jgi:hypothetical protein
MTNLALMLVLGNGMAGPAASGQLTAAPISPTDRYAYGSSAFSAFVNDSFRIPQGAAKFYNWLASAYGAKAVHFADKPHLTLQQYLAFKKQDIAATTDIGRRVNKERAFAAGLHRTIKAVLPTFSLDQGFEFRNAVNKGERQCFLQSVLISSLLQAGGVPAGVATVNRNVEGQETNNKHAICIARLANGHDLIVDASEDKPFVRQKGLFLNTVIGYKFVSPVYETDSTIVAYHGFDNAKTFSVAEILPLNRNFIRSQFEYYRGERTKGGVMASIKTQQGIAAAEYHLAKSVELCPENPLAVYMLGKVQTWQHESAQAHATLEDAMRLYAQDGWIPPDERQALVTVDRSGA